MTSTYTAPRARLDRPLLVSLQYKLGAIVLGVTVVAIALFGSALLRHVEQTEHEEASDHLLEIARQVRSMLAVHHALMVVAVERHQAAFGAMFDGPFHLDATSTLHVDGHHVPQLKVGRQAIGHDFPPSTSSPRAASATPRRCSCATATISCQSRRPCATTPATASSGRYSAPAIRPPRRCGAASPTPARRSSSAVPT